MKITKHAQARQQQRINPMILDLLLMFGKATFDRNCIYRSFADRKIRKKLVKALREAIEFIESDRNIFSVEDDNRLITCGHVTNNRPHDGRKRRAK